MPRSLTAIRAALYLSVIKLTEPNFRVSRQMSDHPGKVTTDGFAETGTPLLHEVGFDIMSLALLADVPVHRPLHLMQNSLIGHWRWLRDVWRYALRRPHCTETETTQSPNAVTEALLKGKSNLAIAHLRDLFKKVQQNPDNPRLHISFLSSLSLFCPFIGTELLWRQGRIDQDPISRPGAKDKEGIIE